MSAKYFFRSYLVRRLLCVFDAGVFVLHEEPFWLVGHSEIDHGSFCDETGDDEWLCTGFGIDSGDNGPFAGFVQQVAHVGLGIVGGWLGCIRGLTEDRIGGQEYYYECEKRKGIVFQKIEHAAIVNCCIDCSCKIKRRKVSQQVVTFW
jgi:hypothetical protein